jgi:hypothetical protein
MRIGMGKYRVFISHGSDESWIALQVGRRIEELGAEAFLDEVHIPKGSNIKGIIHREIEKSDELVALFTPWSSTRSWLWIEIGAAWAQNRPVVAVFYRMQLEDLETNGQGKGILEDINVVQLNEIELYLKQLAVRVDGVAHA